jgi:hypothetical protein
MSFYLLKNKFKFFYKILVTILLNFGFNQFSLTKIIHAYDNHI